jgi:DNA repair protein RecO (recombination protein O)
MPVYKANALVLRRIPLGETDKILTLFTRESGKYNVIAKGARKTTSRLTGATEPLMQIQGLLADGLNLDVLTQCEVVESFPKIRADFGLFLRATYACELLDRLTPERDSAPEIFHLLETTLRLLEVAVDPDAPLHAYELKLMTQTGYEPRLDVCARCETDLCYLPGGTNGEEVTAYSPVRGGPLCLSCGRVAREETVPFSTLATQWMYYLAYEGKPGKIATAQIPAAVAQELNPAIRAHLRVRLERDIRSTAFLDAFRLGALHQEVDSLAEGQGRAC